MVVARLKKYEIIDADQNIQFQTHKELLDDCLGQHGNLRLAEQQINKKSRVWMPNFGTQGKRIVAKSGWINEALYDYNKIITIQPENEPPYPHFSKDHVTLLFAKEGANEKYVFKGAYAEDLEESKDRVFVFYRIATKVKLIGNPVSSIELIDEDRSSLSRTIQLKIAERAKMAQAIEEELDSHHLVGDEREAVVKVRVNQGAFRDLLLKRYDKCCLCGVVNPGFLIASHIKPWRDCKPEEKLDEDNGFILCPNHDSAFDKGYITFNEDGRIMISTLLSEADRVYLNINADMNIMLKPENKKYLAYHRHVYFKRESTDKKANQHG